VVSIFLVFSKFGFLIPYTEWVLGSDVESGGRARVFWIIRDLGSAL
jgi:hypothetical protein